MKSHILFSGYGNSHPDLPYLWPSEGLDANGRYSTFYVLYPIGVGAEFWTTMSAVKEAYAWNPLYAMFMVAVFVGYIPGKILLKEGDDWW